MNVNRCSVACLYGQEHIVFVLDFRIHFFIPFKEKNKMFTHLAARDNEF